MKKAESDRLLIMDNVQRYFANCEDPEDENFFEEDQENLELQWEATPEILSSKIFPAPKFSQNCEKFVKNRKSSDYYFLSADDDEKIGDEV